VTPSRFKIATAASAAVIRGIRSSLSIVALAFSLVPRSAGSAAPN
jgi:hypothetical protein